MSTTRPPYKHHAKPYPNHTPIRSHPQPPPPSSAHAAPVFLLAYWPSRPTRRLLPQGAASVHALCLAPPRRHRAPEPPWPLPCCRRQAEAAVSPFGTATSRRLQARAAAPPLHRLVDVAAAPRPCSPAARLATAPPIPAPLRRPHGATPLPCPKEPPAAALAGAPPWASPYAHAHAPQRRPVIAAAGAAPRRRAFALPPSLPKPSRRPASLPSRRSPCAPHPRHRREPLARQVARAAAVPFFPSLRSPPPPPFSLYFQCVAMGRRRGIFSFNPRLNQIPSQHYSHEQYTFNILFLLDPT